MSRPFRQFLLPASVGIALAILTQSAAALDQEMVVKFVSRHCMSCHNDRESKGDFNIAPLIGAESVAAHLPRWLDVLDQIDFQTMPPESIEVRPSPTEYGVVKKWLEDEIAAATRSSGRLMRRLNRAEYNNTIRDLLKVSVAPADSFPQDLGREGFDNVAEAQSVSPMLLEKYLAAANEAVSFAIVSTSEPQPLAVEYFPLSARQIKGEDPIKPSPLKLEDVVTKKKADQDKLPQRPLGLDWHSGNKGSVREGKGRHGYEVVLGHTGTGGRRGQITFQAAYPGARYRIEAVAYSEPQQDRTGKTVDPVGTSLLGLFVDGAVMETQPVPIGNEPRKYSFEFSTQRARTEVFLAAASSPNKKDSNAMPNLVLCEAQLTGPIYDAWPPRSHRLIFGPQGAWTTEETLYRFVSRAFRRLATDEEVERYQAIIAREMKAGLPPDKAMVVALQAVLVSPNFLYLMEESRDDRSLGDYELACRLSYFLWSSMPDQELFALAMQQTLHDPSILRQQIQRMLKDDKAYALVENFAAQWIGFRRMNDIAPDPTVFKSWDEDLRAAMKAEPEHFFRHVLEENLSVLTFLDSDFTFVNERLARHYGLPHVEGGEFRRVSLPPTAHRGGLVTQAAVLTLASQPTRSSPVFRGKFVVEKLFNRPPPNPPADVPPLEESPTSSSPKTLREQLAQHASQSICADCHAKIDPWGIALESFDGIGGYRDVPPEDLATELPNGRKFAGPEELKEVLLDSKEDFVRGLTEKMLLYALGRTLTIDDRKNVPGICQQVAENGYRFHALIEAIVFSPSFQLR